MRVTEDSPHQSPPRWGLCKEPTDSRTVAGLHCRTRKMHLGSLIMFNCGRQRWMEKRLRANRLRTNVRRQTTALDSQSALMTANQRCFVSWDRFSCAQRLQRVLLQPVPAGVGCRQGQRGKTKCTLSPLSGKNLQCREQTRGWVASIFSRRCRPAGRKWGKDKLHVSLEMLRD